MTARTPPHDDPKRPVLGHRRCALHAPRRADLRPTRPRRRHRRLGRRALGPQRDRHPRLLRLPAQARPAAQGHRRACPTTPPSPSPSRSTPATRSARRATPPSASPPKRTSPPTSAAGSPCPPTWPSTRCSPAPGPTSPSSSPCPRTPPRATTPAGSSPPWSARTEESKSGAGLNVLQRVGARVYTRVEGPLAPAMDITQLKVTYDNSFMALLGGGAGDGDLRAQERRQRAPHPAGVGQAEGPARPHGQVGTAQGHRRAAARRQHRRHPAVHRRAAHGPPHRGGLGGDLRRGRRPRHPGRDGVGRAVAAARDRRRHPGGRARVAAAATPGPPGRGPGSSPARSGDGCPA